MSARAKAILITLGSLLLAGVIIGLFVLDERSYDILWEDVAEGTVGLEPGDAVEAQAFEIFLEASEKERSLRIEPNPESGWGFPDFDIMVNLEDPTGNVIAALPMDHVFEAEDYESEYTTTLKFTTQQDGIYTLYVMPRSIHIGSVELQIREKK